MGMKRGIVKTVEIDPDYMKEDIKAAGYSLRSLSRSIHVDRRTIMNWLKRKEMPVYLVELIENEIHPKKKTVWMRLGVTVPVSEDELFRIMEFAHDRSDRFYNSFHDYDLNETESAEFLKRAIADGESYIPEVCFDQHVDWWLKERMKRGKKNA